MKWRHICLGKRSMLTEEELALLLDHTGVTLPATQSDRFSPVMLIVVHVSLLLILIDLVTRIH